MPPPIVSRTSVGQEVPLTPFSLDKTTTAAQDIAPAVAGRRYLLRAYTMSNEGNAVTTARIRGTIGGVDTILAHQSQDDQVGMVVVLPGFIELDVNTAITGELTVTSENGVLFMIYVETVGG